MQEIAVLLLSCFSSFFAFSCYILLSLCNSSPSCPQKLPCHTEILKHYPCCKQKKKRAIKRFYTLVLSVLRVRQRKRECMHVCVMSAVWLPAAVLLPTGALLSFVRLQGVEKRETKMESPVTKTSPARALSSLIYSPEGVLQKRIKEICAAWKAGQHFYQVLYVSNTEHSFRANKNSIRIENLVVANSTIVLE